MASSSSCSTGEFPSEIDGPCGPCPEDADGCNSVILFGESVKNCLKHCFESQAAETTGNNLATIIVISCGVFALILIVAALVWLLSKRKKNPTKTSDTGENMPEEHEMEPMTAHADENVDNGQSAPSAPPLSVALPASAASLGDGIALDLNKENNEMSPSYDVM